jgi:hypothetical protein
MDKKNVLLLGSVVFGIVALGHLIRSIFSWEVNVANFNVPLYFSYIAVAIAGYLAWKTYKANRD